MIAQGHMLQALKMTAEWLWDDNGPDEHRLYLLKAFG